MKKNLFKSAIIFLLGLLIPVVGFAATTTQINYNQNPLPIRQEITQRFQNKKNIIITQISAICDIFDSISQKVAQSNKIKPEDKQKIIQIFTARNNRLNQIKNELGTDNPQELKHDLLNLKNLITQFRQDFINIKAHNPVLPTQTAAH